MRTRCSRIRAGITSCLGLLLATPLLTTDVHAQRATQAIIDEVVVTARKLTEAEAVQDTPIAITAFGSDQLDALKFRDLSSLSFSMPNVAMDDVGTTKGVANFSIRGLGINSSIPSIDPTVGVFVDGMYLGVNAGVVLDMFDLEAVEVLRGPQGILFGRNVTGGAVLVRTKRPTPTFEAGLKAAVETGIDQTYAGSVSGPLVEGLLNGRLTAYYNEDDGWHKNRFTGDDFGQSRTRLFRPVLDFTPTETLDVTLRYEYGEATGDGPAGQNRGQFDRDTFRFAIDEEGFFENEWQHAILEVNQRVAFGDGLITNILGWRDFENRGVSDIDSLPVFGFHAGFVTEQDQISNELRFAGRFLDRMNITSGLYYFQQEIRYQENRGVATGAPPPFPSHVFFYGGGIQDQKTWGIFSQADYELTPQWILTVGARYTYEEKDVKIASLNVNPGPPTDSSSLHQAPPGACDVVNERGCNFNFRDDDSWDNFTPKVGLQWTPRDNLQLYTFFTQGVRSGGYNLRNTDPDFAPGPFDEEKQDSFELGVKYDTPDRRGRLNVATFFNRISDMQREVNRPDSVFGVSQVVRNTADARIYGIEAEGHYMLLPDLLLTASAGYIESDYTKVRFDLSGDGEAGSRADKKLDLPRLAPFTGSIGLTYDQNILDFGYASFRVNFSHRDRAAYTDNNRGKLNRANMLDASITVGPNSEIWSLSIYGKNLLDEVTEGGDTQLPPNLGGQGASFSPLNKGRVVGAEVRYHFR